MAETIPCIEVEPKSTAIASVIWLHGLGADGNDFVPIIPELGLPSDLPVRFIFPHAPVRPVTVNGGMPMRAWYDILSMGRARDINDSHLYEACDQITQLIGKEEQRGVSSDRILLVGFSQGGAVAYQSALRYPRSLAGLAALSTYRIKPELPEHQATTANHNLPVFVAHGEQDGVVPVELGRQGFESLCLQGFDPVWQTYQMGHEVCFQEIQTLSRWMQQALTGK
ncbi:alpha/beta hydrolase [Motiliproteus sp. MSK22-1]|uniref:alpha/beta hydrolase n=1 Tax=Motiliproteus sp. MSK22-1 TaxID=1897630 RepID=UPI00097638C1|nr:dienelactone hydrolase family protein [Motiliproteus sp. MSK22-1]OMH25706.1 carboxylesterase [Motiliproteus sp. MSK22-1]